MEGRLCDREDRLMLITEGSPGPQWQPVSVYRDNPANASQQPSVNMVVHDAKDSVEGTTDFILAVCHVRSFHGKGFMPILHSKLGGVSASGQVSLGTDQEAYDKALGEGQHMAQTYQESWDADCALEDAKDEARDARKAALAAAPIDSVTDLFKD
jgi:hypothetical protein